MRIKSINWTIISLTPINELNADLISFTKEILIILLIITALAFLFAIVLSNNITSPIRKLVKSMKHVGDGDFIITDLEYTRNDEFSYLISSYKKMVAEIKELISRLYISEVEKKNAELKTLQAQINPHFLYNTLDSINWLAIEHNVSDISNMVLALSDFFRYSLSKGKDIIPIHEEIKQLESYLYLQKIRFIDKLDYDIIISSEISECITVKLILQPIVENAIVHGIKNVDCMGMITVTGEKSKDNIVFKVSDNGEGTDIKKLSELLDNDKISSSFGLKNVNTRIKKCFGNEFGLSFCNNIPSGLTVVVTIPSNKVLEKKYVENDYSRR